MAHFEVENNDTNIQISDELIGPGLLTKGQLTTTWSSFYGEYWDFLITPAADLPIFAYLPTKPVYFNGMYNASTLDDTWRYNVKTAGVQADGGAVVDYWIFDDRAAAGNENFGLALFDATGKASFHSSSKPIRIVGAVQMELPANEATFWQHHNAGTMTSTFSTTVSVPAGKTYAVVTGSPGLCSAVVNTVSDWRYRHYYASAVAVTGGIQVGLLFSRLDTSASGSNAYMRMGSIQFLIVDVTDY